MSVYAVYNSELHLILPDDFADRVIRAQSSLLDSSYGLVSIEWTQDESSAWEDYANLMNQMIKINGGVLDLPNEDRDALILVKL